MAKLVLSKSGLQKQRENMRLYERVLPSLELKRMQLTAELKRTREQLAEAETEMESRLRRISEELPMLADEEMDLSGLVKIETVEIVEENIVGVKLPRLVEVRCHDAALFPVGKTPVDRRTDGTAKGDGNPKGVGEDNL